MGILYTTIGLIMSEDDRNNQTDTEDDDELEFKLDPNLVREARRGMDE